MRVFKIASTALLGAGLAAALAQSAAQVTPADIERAKRSQPVITQQDIDRAVRQHGMPNAADLAKVPPAGAPNIGALPSPTPSQARQQVDLAAVARGFEAGGNAPTALLPGGGPALLVFISFSMPDATLARLVEQAARSNATLVVRGLISNSLQQTALRARQLIGQRKVGFQLDPQAFDRFGVNVVPTFVLLKDGAVPAPCAAGTCYPNASFAAVSGDVSVDYALEHIKRAAPSFGKEAGVLLSAMKARP
ncbi:type-F conjugative transfer system pilin assembly protein TrbC [Azohydromonas aeria]|uniref:type-F conjugative transfer system pilin assembly protein TrbC n=1 Tax=Azohydromonas aeria TaxID=2590212 RepID=UPI0012F89038|nr:type-F conjugative transfer system pilin assembly protein TrbC [Azohydromonas aeria]